MIFSNIASLSKTKGIDLYIQAIEHLDNKDIRFDIVGQASKVEENFEASIKQYVMEKRLNNIKFQGFISNIKIYLDQIDVVVLTSIVPDSLPTVLLEGLAKGKVLIASDVGGVREIVDDGYGNIIIPPNDVKALAEAFKTVLTYDEQKLEEVQIKNIEKAKEKFTIEKQVEMMTYIYLEMMRIK